MSHQQAFSIPLIALVALAELAAVAPASEVSEEGLHGLAATLRPVILNALPKPLYEKSENWGNTVPGIDGIRWRRLRPEIMKGPQNDGHWRKTRVTARDPETSLEFRLGDLKVEGSERLTFKAFLALMINVEREDEFWDKGIRILREEGKARLRIMANLDFEANIRLEAK